MLLPLFAPAFACGGFVPQEGALAASDAQQALFELGEDVTVTYRARYTGNAADFAWVLAVPGVISGVAEGDGARLDEIEEVSAPRIEVDPAVYDESPGCSCAGGMRSKGDFAGDTGGSGVDITGEGYVGDFTYTTLAASDADGLVQWLDDHGYDTSLIAPAIAAYVADPLDYEFVAVQLNPDVPEASAVNLDALEIRYGAAADGALHMVFPATLGQSSTVETVRTEIFVLASGWADIGGWSAASNTEDYDVVGPDYEDPGGLYGNLLSTTGGTTLRAWPVYGGAYEDAWLTRWDSITAPSANTVDPVFTDSGEAVSVDTVVYMQEESAYESGETPAWMLPLGLLGLGVRLRRRR
jgi:MYXO-CTERM domain-containing protein